MTAKGIAAFRKIYTHVASMDPTSLKAFEGQLIKYRNDQQDAMGRTRKEGVMTEISPALDEAKKMLDNVQRRLRNLR